MYVHIKSSTLQTEYYNIYYTVIYYNYTAHCHLYSVIIALMSE